MTMSAKARSIRGPAFWGILFALAMALLAAARITYAIDSTTGFILMACSAVLLVPLYRSADRKAREHGCASAAMSRYNRGMGIAMMGYVLGLGIAVRLHQTAGLSAGVMPFVAMLPVLPIFWMIWAMGRYLVEEVDEYLRHKAIMASLFGLGAVLAIGSFWGFLETFGLAPHAPGWWVVPIWAVGMGLGRLWMRVRGQ